MFGGSAVASLRRLLLRLAIAGAFGCSSGCGTLLSRGEGDFFGAYPFEAVAADGAMIVGLYEPDRDVWALRGLASLPFDLVLDAVFSPIDVATWIAGSDKNRYRKRERTEGDSE